MPIVRKSLCPHTSGVPRVAQALAENETESLPIVLVLVEENFFWEKVESTLRALAKEPFTPDWSGEVAAQVMGMNAQAALVDLENEAIQPLELVRDLRAEDRGDREPLPVLAYASYDREDLLQQAEALGARTVARSTFASSLVRLLQEVTAEEEEDETPATESEEAGS